MYKLYKNLVIENPDAAPTTGEIQAVEEAVKAQLPSDFLEFLNVANGASIDGYYFTIQLKPQAEIIHFSSVFTTKRTSKVRFLSELHFQTQPTNIYRIPEKVLPFGVGGGDVYLYLDLREEGKSSVVAFVHGLPEWTGLTQEDTLVKVADNFTDFLNLLAFDVDDYKQHLQKLITKNETKYISATIEYLNLALPNWREIFGIDYDDSLLDDSSSGIK